MEDILKEFNEKMNRKGGGPFAAVLENEDFVIAVIQPKFNAERLRASILEVISADRDGETVTIDSILTSNHGYILDIKVSFTSDGEVYKGTYNLIHTIVY